MKKLRFEKITILCMLLCLILTSCTDAAEIDDEVYAMAIGIDKGTGDNLILTVQYPTYKGGRKNGSAGGSENKENGEVDGTIVSSIEAPSVLEAINLFNTSTGRRISLMHAKMLVFSEEIAREGVSKYIAPMARFRETRRTMAVVVSRVGANELLSNMISLIGESIPKGIELLSNQSKNNGLFPDSTLHDFYKDLIVGYEQPYAIYASLNSLNNSGQNEPNVNAGTQSSPKYIAGELSRKGGPKVEFLGMAVFKNDKMTGVLDGHETRFFSMITGNFKRGDITLSDTNMKNRILVFDVRQGRKPNIDLTFKDGKPIISINLNIEADIVSIQSRINYEDISKISILEDQLREYLQKGVKNTVEKTQKQFTSDVFGFGRKAAGHFTTVKEWESYKWLDHFKDATVNVNIKSNIRRSGLIFKASPVKVE